MAAQNIGTHVRIETLAVPIRSFFKKNAFNRCDAEPGALADYILALLKHNVPETEMRKELAVQLDEFLEKECKAFIDTLFTVLRTKSYLPYAATPPSPPLPQPQPRDAKTLDTGIPIPLDGLIPPSVSTPTDARPRKRSMETDGRDARPPAKGPRVNADGQFSRYGSRQDGRSSSGAWMDRSQGGYRDGGHNMYRGGMNGGSMGHMNGRRPQSYQPPDQKRGICRDYHNNGYCARGALCKYSHGEDAVVPGQLFTPMAAPGLPFLPMFANGAFGPAVAYDPHEAQMDMRPRPSHQRAPLLPRIQREDGSRVIHPVHASGELPVIQDLTPSLPRDAQKAQGDSELQQSSAPASTSQMLPEGFDQSGFGMAMGAMNMNGFPQMAMNMDIDMAGNPMNMAMMNSNGMYGGGQGIPRGRGAFSGDVHNYRPERRTGTTLVVEKIPEDKLSLEQVNDWFKRFGTVTNVAIDTMNAKALVSFSKHEEAHAAWKSEDAVFNNRFVKVFWHRPMEGHGQVGARLLAASAPLVASMAAKDSNAGTPANTTTPSTSNLSKSTPRKSAAAALAAKQKLLEQQIAEQKSLMASLDTASPEEKKGIMARLRKLGEEMKKPSESITTGSSAAASTSSPAANRVQRSTSAHAEDRERIMRERLDKELEMHHAAIASESGEGESTEELKAKLEKLKAEAASLGISQTGTTEAWHGGGYRGGYRGRGRGARSYYRGAMRGGPPRASMKLDNRPKKLLVKGVNEENVEAVREWFNSTGQVESVETIETGDVVVAFRSRPVAEQALAKGTAIPNVGTVQLTWYTGSASASGRTTTTSSSSIHPPSSATGGGEGGDDSMGDSGSGEHYRPRSPHEEEIIASGWGGGDDDDGDGMGMF
ncbi:hypothetical protein AX17_000017 [Amanita inopinata Kibby_2008]|nr:hypothetical protein AX17_000017 [Amanita inopinata Kibby_2008]